MILTKLSINTNAKQIAQRLTQAGKQTRHCMQSHHNKRQIHNHCPMPIMINIDERAALNQTMTQLTIGGSGRYIEGLNWGWRSLTQDWQNTLDSKASKTINRQEGRKVIFFITDGYTNAYRYNAETAQGNMEYNRGTKQALNKLAQLCEEVKQDNIEMKVFYIRGNKSARNTFQKCASHKNHFFDIKKPNDLEKMLFATLIDSKKHAHKIKKDETQIKLALYQTK